MTISKLVFSARKTRLFMFSVIIVSFLFLISTNYSVYVKTKAYEIYIKIDKSSIKENIQNSNKNVISKINELFKGTVASAPLYIESNSDENLFSIINSTYKYPNASELCSIIPPHLSKGSFKISDLRPKINTTVLELNIIEKLFQNLSLTHGGLWSPKGCKARHRVAVVVPYRDREANLKLFLHHMHPFLMRQQTDYGVFIVEPVQNIKFNRGMLMNIGYVEASKMLRNGENNTHWQCFVFHDADLLPEDERNLYSCPEQPRHMSSAVSTFNYKLPYETLFGGVTMFSNAQYEKVNGFSNLFFGWGGEDDDLANRVTHRKFKIARYPLEIGRYTMAQHEKDKPNVDRHKYLANSYQRMDKDGLNSLKYKIIKTEKTMLYTKIYVYYNETEIMSQKY